MPKTKQMSDVEKGQIIAFSKEKMTVRQIALAVGFSKSSVADFLKKFRENGCTERKKGSGRPKKTSAAQDRLIKLKSLQDRSKTSQQIRKELKDACGVEVDDSTVRRRLIDAGLFGRRPAKKPFLNKAMKKKRSDWAKIHQTWTEEDWKSVIFSDESKFNLFGSDGMLYVRRRTGERFEESCIRPTVRQSSSRMIWGCFSYHGTKALALIDGRVNGEKYISILKEHLIPCLEETYQFNENVTFQDDSAPCHRSHIVKKFVEENGIVQMEWPGNSPDMNPIEHLWAIMKKKVAAHKPSSLPELDKIIQSTWDDEISEELLQMLVKSMPRRINAVLKAKGGSTKY